MYKTPANMFDAEGQLIWQARSGRSRRNHRAIPLYGRSG